MYNFKRLIKKYSKYDMYIEKVLGEEIDMEQGGKVVQKVEKYPITGALITDEDVIAYTGGGITKEGVLKLYTYTEIEENSTISVVEDDGVKEYNVRDIRDYSRFDKGLFACTLERSGR